MGCRQWLVVTRDTLSHEITECMPAEQAAGIEP
jgi:sarcosine oxidase delta subunit